MGVIRLRVRHRLKKFLLTKLKLQGRLAPSGTGSPYAFRLLLEGGGEVGENERKWPNFRFRLWVSVVVLRGFRSAAVTLLLRE